MCSSCMNLVTFAGLLKRFLMDLGSLDPLIRLLLESEWQPQICQNLVDWRILVTLARTAVFHRCLERNRLPGERWKARRGGPTARSCGHGFFFEYSGFMLAKKCSRCLPTPIFDSLGMHFGNRHRCLWTAQQVCPTSLRAFFSFMGSASNLEGCLRRFAYCGQQQIEVSRVGKHFSC